MGLFQESCAQVELRQSAISLHDIEPDARVQLAQVDGTQVHRASIALGQVIRAIHEAMKIDAMHDAEHMRHLVRQHLAAPLQQQLFEVPRLLIIETRIVARKAVDAHAVAKRGLAEHEVPRRIRVEIFHRDTQDRVSILRHPLAQKRQDVRREQLPVMRVWIEAGRYGARCDVERRKQFHFEREEHGGESFQPLERRTGAGGGSGVKSARGSKARRSGSGRRFVGPMACNRSSSPGGVNALIGASAVRPRGGRSRDCRVSASTARHSAIQWAVVCECAPPCSEMCAMVCPAVFESSCSTRSPMDRMPTRRLSRFSTGSRRTFMSLMFFATSSRSSSSNQYSTSVDMTSRIFVSGDRPCATARTVMSRSVIMPTSRSFSPTGNAPASMSAIKHAASQTLCSGLAMQTSFVITSRTFMACSSSLR